jgi:hypothetical protein
MKTTRFLLIIFTLLLVSCMKPLSARPPQRVSYQVFYDELSPYGQWVDEPQYGYVWVPDVPRDFRPYYTNGYWVMTTYGNTWYSDYPWGWATFHYGRWIYDPFYGWVWVPGYEWAPAWVCWRQGYGYYGWAPLSPGFSITVSFSSYLCPSDWWIFIPPAYIYDRHFHHYWNGPRRNDELIHHTTVINNTQSSDGHFAYPVGPAASDIQAQTGRAVPVYQVNEQRQPTKTSISSNTVSIYRPEITRVGRDVKPPRVVEAPRPIDKPASVGVNAGHDPGFRSVAPRREVPANEPVRTTQPLRNNEPVRDQRQENPVQPQRIERPNPRPPAPERPARRNEDDIYKAPPDRNRQPVINPPQQQRNEQPRVEQPRIEQPRAAPPPRPEPAARPAERPMPQQPVQRAEPVMPRREMPVPQPQRNPPPGRR